MSLAMYAPHVDHGGGSRKKRPVNSGSTLLDSTDNQRLFALIGQDNVSLSAGVVELLEANGREWKRTARGVVSLIKDYQKRSYFMRLYDVWSGLTIWEFHLYKGFEAAYHAGCLNLLTFDDENDSKVLALNFSSQEEAANFKLHLDKRREQEQKSGELNATVQS